jgi:hypothetical protein
MSASARLRLAAATIYHSVATKAAALSQWLLNAAMTANPLGIIIVALVALAGVLYYVEKRTHIFSNAWKSLAKSDFVSGMIGGVDKLYSKLKATGLLKFVAGGITGALGISSKDEIKEKIWAGMMGLLRWASTTFPFMGKIHEVLKKVHSIFEWIWSLWSAFWGWIKSAMPGAAKETARLKMEKKATNEGLYLGSDEKWYKLGSKGEKTGISASSANMAPSEKLTKLYGEYKDLPGFAEGIAQAVAKGISGIGTTIANAIKGLVLEIPGMAGLIKTIEGIQNWLEEHFPNGAGTGSGPGIADSSTTASYTNPKGDTTYQYTPSTGKVKVTDWRSPGFPTNTVNFEDLTDESAKTALEEEAKRQNLVTHASGATFHKKGIYKGIFDQYEEVIPQATASKGPGPISRALEILYGVDSNKSSAGQGSDKTEIHVHNSNDFSGMKVSNDIDIEKLMGRIDKRIREVSVAAVRDSLGQRRT